MLTRICFTLLLCTCSLAGFSQRAAKRPASTVSGHVYCADTNAPARFASVSLVPAAYVDQADPGAPSSVRTEVIQTLPDGSFSILKVAPGVYYVNVSQPGYISPVATLGVSQTELKSPTALLRKQLASTIPTVRVQANLPATVDVTLQRGAAVSGTVLYDDGSPAVGLSVQILTRQLTPGTPDKSATAKTEKWQPLRESLLPGATQVETDDHGAYRFAGLPAGKYLLVATLHVARREYTYSTNGSFGVSSGDQDESLPIYSGGSFRTADATPFSLKRGEERPGEDLQIPLNKLHTVAGALTAARDGHTVNGGSVALLHADDRSELASIQLSRTTDGFSFSFVPAGDYIVEVTGARDVAYLEQPSQPGEVSTQHFKAEFLHSYASTEQPLHVENDVSGLAISLPELRPSHTQ